MNLETSGIDNFDVICDRDAIEEMVSFYTDVLGLTLYYPREQGQDWAAIDAGNVVIYVFTSSGKTPPPPRSTMTLENPPGLASFAFAVDDLDSAIATLDGKVHWATDEPERWDHPSGTWYRYRGFYDPAGTLLYVTEPHKHGEGQRASP
jgi:catechol 2,3-dioxygenase-like lactoylglutathione lyase family enzyme